jgi:glycosyltransferase involved in cell wall biosynthesis
MSPVKRPPVRVLLGVAWYLPDSIGGTEKYVRGLAAELKRAGVDVAIAVPAPAATRVTRELVDDVPVFRFAPTRTRDFDVDTHAPNGWQEILEAVRPTIVDLHSLTSTLGLPHLRAARALRARTLVTVHLPGLVCARGSLLRFGRELCDGDLRRQPCTACRLEARGVPPSVGAFLSDLPSGLGDWLDRLAVPGAARRAITADDSHRDRLRWLAAITDSADRIVAVSNGLKAMLLRNGVPAEKVVVCSQGVDRPGSPRPPYTGTRVPGVLKVGFVGRFDPIKGLDVLVDAAERIPPDSRIEFHIWGAARTPAAQAYRDAMMRGAQGLRHVTFHGEATSTAPYDTVDILAVPSTWYETGPFVVLEAHAAGVPVVGSDLGGIAERVTDGRNGLLFPPGDANALAGILRQLARNPAQLAALRPHGPVRTIADVARETLDTYAVLAAERAA